jgi:hypothetical protein
VLKRGKDVFWVLAGLLLLSRGRRPGAPLLERAS